MKQKINKESITFIAENLSDAYTLGTIFNKGGINMDFRGTFYHEANVLKIEVNFDCILDLISHAGKILIEKSEEDDK